MKAVSRPQHIGIVACSAEGTSLCYRTICTEGSKLLGPHAHPEMSIHSYSLADYVDCIYRGDWPAVAELMLSSAHKLAESGADFLICPSGGMFGSKKNDPMVQARSKENRLPIVFVHPAEFLVTDPDGSIRTRTLIGNQLVIPKSQVGGKKDTSRIFYFDLCVGKR